MKAISQLSNDKLRNSNLYTIDKHHLDSISDTEEKFKTRDVSVISVKSLDEASIAAKINKLKQWEAHVISHERMHMMTGGSYVSAASYTYTYGPDGRRYIAGGEVNFKLPVGASMESGIAALRKLKAAATAVADPSAADLQAAAMAGSIESSVINQLIRKQAKEAYEKERVNENILKGKQDEFISPISKMRFKEVAAFQLFV